MSVGRACKSSCEMDCEMLRWSGANFNAEADASTRGFCLLHLLQVMVTKGQKQTFADLWTYSTAAGSVPDGRRHFSKCCIVQPRWGRGREIVEGGGLASVVSG